MNPYITTTDRTGRNVIDLASSDFTTNRRIFLTGEINEALAEQIILNLEYLDSVSGKPITIYINSRGGEVHSGLAILDAMQRCRSPIITLVTGLAASMAAVIAAAGTVKSRRIITPNAEMMIHQPLGGISGQASDVERSALHIIKVKQRLNEILSNATGKPMDIIAADSDRDFYLSADEAVEYGLVDRILDAPYIYKD